MIDVYTLLMLKSISFLVCILSNIDPLTRWNFSWTKIVLKLEYYFHNISTIHLNIHEYILQYSNIIINQTGLHIGLLDLLVRLRTGSVSKHYIYEKRERVKE